MTDPQLSAALRTRSAGALADLFDAYGERLFRYCWCALRSREIAQLALRDTLIVAAANIARLADPELLGPWLYSLARAECRRRRPLPPAQADEPPARPSHRDAEARLVAWNAVTSLDGAEIEALDLVCRHDVDLGLVLGLSPQDVRALLDRARLDLRRALGAEILINMGSHDCPDRAEVMHGWTGTVTPELRERVLRHAADCPVCGPHLPNSVSATRVFALLPDPALPPGARAEVLGFFGDPRMSGCREFAVSRAPELGESGFPVPGRSEAQQTPRAPRADLPGAVQRSGVLRSGALLPVAAAIVVAALVASAFILSGSRTRTDDQAAVPVTHAAEPQPSDTGTATTVPVVIRPSQRPAIAGPAAPRASEGAKDPVGPEASERPTAAGGPTRPTLASSAPPALAHGPAPGPPGSVAVTSGRLALGAGSVGAISVSVVGGPVNWSASTTSKQVTLSSYHGTLRAEHGIMLVVTVRRVKGAGGSAAVYIDPVGAADQAVGVSWAARPARPARPAADPSASPSASPSPSPSTSPSPSPPPPSATSTAPESPAPSDLRLRLHV